MSRHLDNAVLRRYIDEPDALLSFEKEHLLQCVRCRAELERLRDNAAIAERALADGELAPDMTSARAAIAARAASPWSEGVAKRAVPITAFRSRWSIAAAAAIAIVALFAYAPFRAYAANVLTIFEPHTVSQINVSSADVKHFRDIPELRELGTVSEEGNAKAKQYASLVAAEKAANERIVRPAYLPSSIANASTYVVSPPTSMRFTFDARKAKASAAKHHLTIPSPPPAIDGSTLTASSGTVVVQYYGATPEQLRKDERASHEFPQNGVIVMQGAVPTVRSTGADARQIEEYLLSLPNVPADLKAQIRAIQDPSGTLPLPVIVDKHTATPITIHGSNGLLIGDNTGVGGFAVWISHGRFYSVAGGFKADEIQKIAESMETPS